MEAASDQPVPALNLRLEVRRSPAGQAGGSHAAAASSGADGAFTFVDVPPGDYLVSIARGQSWVGRPVHVSVGESDVTSVVVRVNRLLTLAGRVIRSGSGTAVPRLTVQAKSTEVGILRAMTGDDGAFAFGRAPWAGRVELAAASDPERTLAVADMVADRTDLVLEWDGTGVIAGRVRDSTGSPVFPVEVLLAGEGDLWPPIRAQGNVWRVANTAEDGSFRIDDLPAGRSYRIVFGAAGYADEVSERVLVPSTDVLVVLHREATLTGTARGSDGMVRSGLVAWCSPQVSGRGPAQVVADAEGSFRLALPPGTYVVAPAGQFEFDSRKIELAEGTEIRLDLEGKVDARIRGIVVDAVGKPVGATLGMRNGRKEQLPLRAEARPLTTRVHGVQGGVVRPDGGFEIGGLQHGVEYAVTVGTEDGMDTTAAVQAMAPGDVRIPWTAPDRRVRFVAVDADNAEIPGADIWVLVGPRSRLYESGAAVALRQASVTVLAGARGFGASRQDLELGAGSQEVRVRLLRGRSVRGEVIDDSGAAVRGARVCAADAEFGFPSTVVTTDEQGRFELNSLPAEGGYLAVLGETPRVTSQPAAGDLVRLTVRRPTSTR